MTAMKTESALAAVLYEPGSPLRVEEVEVLPPQQGEVTVRMKAAGICHSDWHVMCGDLKMPLPLIPGHEGAGVVTAVGEGVSTVEVGDHVILMWRGPCGRCEYCARGRPALCDMGTAMRFQGTMPDGTLRFRNSAGQGIRHYAGVSAFASLATMPEASVVKIPAHFSFEKAALIGCGVITGVGAVTNAAQVTVGSTVAVFGVGGIGLNIVQGARMAGARRIIAVDIHERKLADSLAFGATDLVNATQSDPVAAVRQLTDGKGAEFTFEAVGLPDLMAQAFDATKKGGRCVVVGIAGAEARAPINVNQLVYAEKSLIGSLYGTTRPRQDLLMLMDMHEAGKLMLDELISQRWNLHEINEAYEQLLRGEVKRSLIVWDD
jgi:S-(hydroxymethyl)glutathione dehydrogenase / alcohol dehydrogenase